MVSITAGLFLLNGTGTDWADKNTSPRREQGMLRQSLAGASGL